MIPLLTVMGVPIHTAVGTCLAFVACASLAGIIQHVRQGSIDPIIALTMTFPAALMASVAARFSSLLPPQTLHVLFSLLLVGFIVLYRFAPAVRPLNTLPDPPALASQWYVLHRQRIIGDMPYQYDFDPMKAILGGYGHWYTLRFFWDWWRRVPRAPDRCRAPRSSAGDGWDLPGGVHSARYFWRFHPLASGPCGCGVCGCR